MGGYVRPPNPQISKLRCPEAVVVISHGDRYFANTMNLKIWTWEVILDSMAGPRAVAQVLTRWRKEGQEQGHGRQTRQRKQRKGRAGAPASGRAEGAASPALQAASRCRKR